MTTWKATSALPLQVLPVVTSLPIDGYGGSYYDLQFSVPVYALDDPYGAIYHSISWSNIDTYYTNNVSNAIEDAVSFGICATTLLNLIALTPQHKRRLPLFVFMCLGLTFQVIRNIADMVTATHGLWVASYIYLAVDVESSTISDWYYAMCILDQAAACLTFVFVQACFFIQARALMTWLRVHHGKIFYVLLTLCVGTSIVALGFRIGLAIVQIRYLDQSFENEIDRILRQGHLILYTISIGGWSSVFFISAMSIILTRRRDFFSGGTIYDIALNLIAIVGIQSFIIPILFCILQFLPIHSLVNEPERFILPSVLFLLPISTLFATIHGNNDSSGTYTAKKDLIPQRVDRDTLEKLNAGADQRHTPIDGAVIDQPHFNNISNRTATGKPPTKIPDSVEAELAFIDSIDEGLGSDKNQSLLIKQAACET